MIIFGLCHDDVISVWATSGVCVCVCVCVCARARALERERVLARAHTHFSHTHNIFLVAATSEVRFAAVAPAGGAELNVELNPMQYMSIS